MGRKESNQSKETTHQTMQSIGHWHVHAVMNTFIVSKNFDSSIQTTGSDNHIHIGMPWRRRTCSPIMYILMDLNPYKH